MQTDTVNRQASSDCLITNRNKALYILNRDEIVMFEQPDPSSSNVSFKSAIGSDPAEQVPI